MQQHHRAAHRARPRLRGRRRLRRRLLRRRDLADVRRAHPAEARRHGGRGRCRPRAASATRATSRSGRATSPRSRSRQPGPRRGAPAVPAGTSSARRWRSATSAPEFDIHGGGLDLRFPHHENELAQSTAAGDGFAQLLGAQRPGRTSSGQKMSKSLGNSVYAASSSSSRSPLAVRYYLGGGALPLHARLPPASLAEAEAAVDRIDASSTRVERRLAGTRSAGVGSPVIPDAFAAAMDDDLGVPQALAVLHDTVRAGNTALDAEDLTTPPTHARPGRRDDRGARHQPARPALGDRRRRPAASALDALVARLLEDRAGAPARRRTSPPPTGSATSSPRRASPSKTARPARIGAWDHEGQQRSRAPEPCARPKGKQVGTGGQGRKALEGKGPTPKAEDRA